MMHNLKTNFKNVIIFMLIANVIISFIISAKSYAAVKTSDSDPVVGTVGTYTFRYYDDGKTKPFVYCNEGKYQVRYTYDSSSESYTFKIDSPEIYEISSGKKQNAGSDPTYLITTLQTTFAFSNPSDLIGFSIKQADVDKIVGNNTDPNTQTNPDTKTNPDTQTDPDTKTNPDTKTDPDKKTDTDKTKDISQYPKYSIANKQLQITYLDNQSNEKKATYTYDSKNEMFNMDNPDSNISNFQSYNTKVSSDGKKYYIPVGISKDDFKNITGLTQTDLNTLIKAQESYQEESSSGIKIVVEYYFKENSNEHYKYSKGVSVVKYNGVTNIEATYDKYSKSGKDEIYSNDSDKITIAEGNAEKYFTDLGFVKGKNPSSKTYYYINSKNSDEYYSYCEGNTIKRHVVADEEKHLFQETVFYYMGTFNNKDFYITKDGNEKIEIDNGDADSYFKELGFYKREDDSDNVDIDENGTQTYSIQDIIFNKVPLFDVNVFTDTPGGKIMKEDSIEYTIRRVVAIWYVGLRNITFVIIAILLIYYGIKMTITTSTTEKADCKEMLVGWLKGLILAVILHYIIYILLTLNDSLVKTISESTPVDDKPIYETIKTRMTSVSWKVKMPATIMYLTLLIMWTRFIWIYLKRVVQVFLLIIYSPLVIAKYTFENANGKESSLFRNWLHRFITAVYIQSIHALLYIVFAGSAMDLAFERFSGFILALMLLNFMLSADKVFTDIFSFHFSGKDMDDLRRPFSPKQDLSSLFISYGATKGAIQGLQKFHSGTLASTFRVAVDDGINYLNDNTKIVPKIKKASEFVPNAVDEAIRKVTKERFEKANENKKQKIQSTPLTAISSEAYKYFTLRKLSRKKGKLGVNARATLKLKHNQYKRVFTSGFKLVKLVSAAGAETILFLPISANYGMEAGITDLAMATDNIKKIWAFASNGKGYRDYDAYLDDIVSSVNQVDANTKIVTDKFGMLSDSEKEIVKNQIKEYNRNNIDSFKIQSIVNNYMYDNRLSQLSKNDVSNIMKIINKELPDSMTEQEKQQVMSLVMQKLYSIDNEEFDNEDTSTNENQTREEQNSNQEQFEDENASNNENATEGEPQGEPQGETGEEPQEEKEEESTEENARDNNEENARERRRRERREKTQRPVNNFENYNQNGNATNNQNSNSTSNQNNYATNNQNSNSTNNQNNNETNNQSDSSSSRHISYTRSQVIDTITDSFIEKTFGQQNNDIGKAIDKLNAINSKENSKENSMGKIINLKTFTDGLK